MPFAPAPPSKPPGPPAPALVARDVALMLPLPPGPPLTSSTPAIVTLLVASSVTGVLAALRVKRTVTPAGMVIVVKLNTPEGGSVSVVLEAGAKGPSAPVPALPSEAHMPTHAMIANVMSRRMRRLLDRCSGDREEVAVR
jgi:hypothetical protein